MSMTNGDTPSVTDEDDMIDADAVSDTSEPADAAFEPSPDAVAAYDTLMANLFPEALALAAAAPVSSATHKADSERDDDEQEGSRPMSKAEKQNAKKKRRKERERALRALAMATETIPPSTSADFNPDLNSHLTPTLSTPLFRLFSSTPAMPVSLIQVEDYPLPIDPRLAPLSSQVKARIRSIASEAALSVPNLPSIGRRKNDTIDSIHAGQSALPAVFVATTRSVAKNAPKPAVPVVKVIPSYQAEGKSKSATKRRRRCKTPRERPAPKFWRPARNLGGKSAGYAYGWGIV